MQFLLLFQTATFGPLVHICIGNRSYFFVTMVISSFYGGNKLKSENN